MVRKSSTRRPDNLKTKGNMEQIWYRADFRVDIGEPEPHYPDSDYFTASSDEEALEYAKDRAKDGWIYDDVNDGEPCPTELDYLVRVNADEETFPEVGSPIYY